MAGPDLIGQVLDRRFRVEARLGQGGFGAVFRARHLELDRVVAIKIITDPRPDLIARFRREARLQAKLRHPALVELLDFAHDDALDLYFLVQAYVPGETLGQIVRRDGALATRTSIELVSDLLAGLDVAHAAQIVHRDIKPANIMIVAGRRRVEARLLDFGISKHFDVDDGLTQTGAFLGTPAFMAPEQTASEPIDGRADIYAMGALLYYMLTGQYPFTGPIYTVLLAHRQTPPPHLPSSAPTALDEIVQRAMAKTADARFQTADAMRRALLAVLDALDVAPDPRDAALLDTLAPDPAHASLPPTADSKDPATPSATHAVSHLPKSLTLMLLLVVIGVPGVALLRAPAPAPLDSSLDARATDERPIRAVITQRDAYVARPDTLEPAVADAGPGDASRADPGPPSPDADPSDSAAETSRQAGAEGPPRRVRRAPSRPPPASEPDARAPPPPPNWALVVHRFDQHLDACRCDEARAALEELRRLDRAGVSDERRFRRQCEMALDGSCLTR